MTQAKFCIKQKRPLFAVVQPDSGKNLGLLSAGTNSLVAKSHAQPLRGKIDYGQMLDTFSQQRLFMEADVTYSSSKASQTSP